MPQYLLWKKIKNLHLLVRGTSHRKSQGWITHVRGSDVMSLLSLSTAPGRGGHRDKGCHISQATLKNICPLWRL